MSILAETARAIVVIGLPVAVLTFGLAWWALKNEFLGAKDDVRGLAKEIKALGKRQKKEPQKLNPVHRKWIKLGGGFYGSVGLYTYFLIEWEEVVQFLKGIPTLVLRLDIGILIGFLLASFANFITAVTWPLYWLGHAPEQVVWLWFLVAYAGYWAGLNLAQRRLF